MPDKYYATGRVSVTITIPDVEFEVEGYGQTEAEAKKDAQTDIEKEIEENPQGALALGTTTGLAETKNFRVLDIKVEKIEGGE